MDHIQDVYKKKPEMISKIWDYLTKVNLKVDGKPFQVVYNEDEDELEYHGRSGNETKVGPLIDDMQRLFSKPINDAIRHIETRKDIFKEYKFLTFEVIGGILLLTAIIDKSGKFINNPKEIKEIADKLETDVMPCLWEGKISDEQKTTLMDAISTDIIPTKNEFVEWVKALFGTYKDFPKSLISRSEEFIEGLVFFYNVDGKIVEYKLVDPTYRNLVKDNQNKKQDDETAKKFEKIYEIFVDWAEENAKGLDKNRMKSIEFNFIEMMSDVKRYNKLMNLGTGLTTNTTDAYFLQLDRVSDELRKVIKKHGKVYQLLYEKFVRLFYKSKKRAFVISKEFQERVNDCVEKFADYSLNEDEIEIDGEIINEAKKDFGTSFDFTIDKDKMHKDIPDANFNINRDDYIDNVIDMICTRGNSNHNETIFKLDKNKNVKLVEFIGVCYDHWVKNLKQTKNNVPFRFNEARDIKLCRSYGCIVDEWKQSKYGGYFKNIDVTTSTDKQKILKIVYGNGLGGGSKSGMYFEHTLYESLKTWILGNFGIDWDDNTFNIAAQNDIGVAEILKSLTNDNLFTKQIKLLLKSVKIDETSINNYIQNPAPSNRPFATDITNNDNFKTSGNRIADIIITGEPKFKELKTNKKDKVSLDVNELNLEKTIFISVKKHKHQWTGSTVSPDEYGSHWLKYIIEDKTKNTKPWKTFWEKIGIIDTNDELENSLPILSALKNRVNKSWSLSEYNKNNKNIIQISENNEILQMAQRLLGTNYWIIQEGNKNFGYIKQEIKNETAKLIDIIISKSKTKDSLTLKIISDKCTLVVRTTGSSLIVRIFPEFNDEQLNNLLE